MSRIADLRQASLDTAVSRVWTLAGCLAVVVERPQEELLREVTGIDTFDRRSDLYTLTLAGLERCAELLEQAHIKAVDELGSRGRPDLDESTIAEAARLDLRQRRRSWHACRLRNGMVP